MTTQTFTGFEPEELRDAVRDLIAEDRQADVFVASLAYDLFSSHETDDDQDLRSVLDESSRYRWQGRIDQGGSAEVHRASDTLLGRDVAIKIFRANEEGVAIALEEAKALSQIVDPRVVGVLDVVRHSRHPYIVMELVAEHVVSAPSRHPDLEQYITTEESDGRVIGQPASRTAPQSIAEAVQWVIDGANGVKAAHQLRIFHHDVKPNNVLITPVSRRAKVIDFGLVAGAHYRGTAKPGTLSITDERIRIAGTPEYMAPEQAHGVPIEMEHDAATAIDVFGLGALAFYLLSGLPPHKRAFGESPWLVVRRIRQGKSRQRLRVSDSRPWSRIPPRLETMVERALDTDPTKRYPNVEAFVSELQAFLDNMPLKDDSLVTRVSLAVRRRPVIWSQVFLSLVVLLVMLLSVREMSFEVAGLARQRKALQSKNRTLTSTKEGLSQRIDHLSDEADRKKREVEKIRSQLDEVKGRADELGILNQELENEKDALEIERRALVVKGRKLRGENKGLRTSNEELENNKETLQKEKLALEAKNTGLTSDKETLQKENTALEAKNTGLTSDKETLQKEKLALEAKNTGLTSDKETLQKENTGLTSDKETLQKENTSLKSDKKALEDKVRELQAELDKHIVKPSGNDASISGKADGQN